MTTNKGDPCVCGGEVCDESCMRRQSSSASQTCSVAISLRFAQFLRDVLSEGWEYGDGEPMEEDIKKAIAWIESHGGM